MKGRARIRRPLTTSGNISMKFRIMGAAFAMAMMASANAVTASGANTPVPEASQKAAFIPPDFNVPTLVETADFKIVPLGPDLAKVDFDAYMSSIEHLQKTFTRSTGWPHENITDADALQDMLNEQARFESRTSFAYAVLTPDGSRELGCVYVYPSPVSGYDAEVRMWVTKAQFDAGFDAELYNWVIGWMADWPFEKVAYPGRSIDWETWDTMIAEHKPEALASTG